MGPGNGLIRELVRDETFLEKRRTGKLTVIIIIHNMYVNTYIVHFIVDKEL